MSGYNLKQEHWAVREHGSWSQHADYVHDRRARERSYEERVREFQSIKVDAKRYKWYRGDLHQLKRWIEEYRPSPEAIIDAISQLQRHAWKAPTMTVWDHAFWYCERDRMDWDVAWEKAKSEHKGNS